MPTYLITGGAGFIGSHLADGLLERGHRVLALDDLSSGSVKNVAHLRSHPRFEFIVGNVDKPAVVAELVDAADAVFHLAATVGVFNIIDSPIATLSNNLGGTEAVLQAAAKKKKKVLVASTSEVYGKSNAAAFREDGDLVLGPTCKARWSYAASKIVDEFLALAYWRELRVPTVIVRLFNTIGPRQVGHYGMVVPRFLGQALRGENITVYGDGQQSRCFTYIADVVEWLVRLIDHPSAVGEIFNLGNPREVTIEELARLVLGVTGADVGIDYVPYDQAYAQGFEDMARRLPDIAKVTALTGYAPQITLEQALCRCWDWIQSERRRETPASVGQSVLV